MNENPTVLMAPLKGVTDASFRSVYCRHFTGLDGAIAPFVNPQHEPTCSFKLLVDLHPDNNDTLPLIPQLLNTDADGFLALADRLHDWGYQEINWNLGCPVRMVARKRRGSGLLPYPDAIVDLLEQVLPRLRQRLSIKMRLGFNQYRESHVLLPRLDDFPLTEIIIHARLGRQLYSGPTAPAEFSRCIGLTRHRLVYNGDITDLTGYRDLTRQLPGVNRWMIGRGLLANPFLPAEIKGETCSGEQRYNRLADFHDDLYQSLRQRLSGPGHLLGRLKQVWIYFSGAFPGREKQLKKVIRATSEASYRDAVKAVFMDE